MPSRRSFLNAAFLNAMALGLAGASLPLTGQVADAADFQPGLIYAVGQKFDKSFNEGAFAGAERFKAASGIGYREHLPNSAAQFDQSVAALLRRGVTDLVCIGFFYAQPLAGLAPRHPDRRFTLIDAAVDAPNVRSVLFREQEGAFLTGIMAALAAKRPVIGFIGALDIPLIRRYIAGYTQGARHVRPDIEVLVNFVGTTPAAFSDPTTGAEVARLQMDRGAEVIFAGAGVSNLGIFAAAKDGQRLAIGVDSNQNPLYPGTMLTSMLKRVDIAVEESFQQGRNGSWQAGIRQLGLTEGGVDIAIDDHNRPLLNDAMLSAVESARQAIINGTITVADGIPG